MSESGFDPIHKPEQEAEKIAEVESGNSIDHDVICCSVSNTISKKGSNDVIVKRERPTRACTSRTIRYVDPPVIERRYRVPKKEKVVVEEENCSSSGGGSGGEEDDENGNEGEGYFGKCKKVVTSLVNPPTFEQMPRWNLRSMWELASILHFLHVFRPLLNINVEFSAEELESALLTPNGTLGEVHIPLLKSIPPVTRMACGLDTWVTVLCRKLRDWWHWVADGELPIVTSQGAEIETYKNLDPAVRVVILKALCDIRVEQDDIRSYIDNSVKHGVQLSAFRKVRIGGDSHGISYWYEDDELIGHRLYREIRKVEKQIEANEGSTEGSHVLRNTTYGWETVATNLDEFLDVSEKLFASTNRTEVSVGKKLKNNMLPEIEKIHTRKEKLLKKQQRRALLLDNFVNMDEFGVGRSRRDRKPVSYTFDEFDRSINEALKVTKHKQPSPEHGVRREVTKSEPSANGRWNCYSHASMRVSFPPLCPPVYDEMDEDHKSVPSDRSTRRRQKPQRYSEEFVGTVSDNEEYINSDDDIIGEAVYYDDAELKHCKQKIKAGGSDGEGDDEYHWSDENIENDVDEDEEESVSGSEDGYRQRGRFKCRVRQTRQGTMLRSVNDMDPGLRQSTRSNRNQINYQHYVYSAAATESLKRRRTNPSEIKIPDSDEGDEDEYRGGRFSQSEDSDDSSEKEPRELGFGRYIPVGGKKEENKLLTKSESPSQDELDGLGERRFLDLNELAPGPSFDDFSSAKGE